jgi:dUTP pyrophosphatase
MIFVKCIRLSDDAIMPVHATAGAAGADLFSVRSVDVPPGETVCVPTGIAMEIPEGFEGQVRPRGGLSLNTGLRIANSPGTVDSDYRGEIIVLVHNTDQIGTYVIQKHQRIAQLVIKEVPKIHFVMATELSSTDRGKGRLGHTGDFNVRKTGG